MLTDRAAAPLCESEVKYFLINMLHKRLALATLSLMNMKKVQTHGYHRRCLHLQKRDLMLLYVRSISQQWACFSAKSILVSVNIGDSLELEYACC